MTIQNLDDDDATITYTGLYEIAKAQFPPTLTTHSQKEKKNTIIYRHIITNRELALLDKQHRFYKALVELIDLLIGKMYRKVQGRYWKSNKLQEMVDEPLIYVFYSSAPEVNFSKSKAKDYQVSAFISFMYTEENSEKILYLYEIHVAASFQKAKLGSMLLGNFHACALLLGSNDKGRSIPCNGTELTVFSENQVAYKWYFKNGYSLAHDSPVDIEVGDEIEQPEYYILHRPMTLKNTHSTTLS